MKTAPDKRRGAFRGDIERPAKTPVIKTNRTAVGFDPAIQKIGNAFNVISGWPGQAQP